MNSSTVGNFIQRDDFLCFITVNFEITIKENMNSGQELKERKKKKTGSSRFPSKNGTSYIRKINNTTWSKLANRTAYFTIVAKIRNFNRSFIGESSESLTPGLFYRKMRLKPDIYVKKNVSRFYLCYWEWYLLWFTRDTRWVTLRKISVLLLKWARMVSHKIFTDIRKIPFSFLNTI